MALFVSVGSLSLPSPSIVNEISWSFVGVNSASFHKSKARPRASNPGPRLAVVAGTLTRIFIGFFLNREGREERQENLLKTFAPLAVFAVNFLESLLPT